MTLRRAVNCAVRIADHVSASTEAMTLRRRENAAEFLALVVRLSLHGSNDLEAVPDVRAERSLYFCLSLHGSNDLEAESLRRPGSRFRFRLSLHGSNDLEAAATPAH